MKRLLTAAPLLLFLLVPTVSFAQGPNYSGRGALLGGLLGAGAGAAIGDGHNHHAGQGALIGGALGAIGGAVVGNNIDNNNARQQYATENRIYQQQYAQQLQGTVTTQDIISMQQGGLGDDVICNHIRANGLARTPNVNELIYLRRNGVSDMIIQTMQTTRPIQQQQVIVQQRQPATQVIVQERYYQPYYAPPPPVFYYHHHHGYHGGW